MYRIGQEEIEAVARAILSHDFFKINNSGKEVLNFENEWKEVVAKDYALLMTSGFGALVSGLIGMGIGPGDEVIVPGYTYIASALAVTAVGAIPVIAEIDETMKWKIRKRRSPPTPRQSSPFTFRDSPPIWTALWLLPQNITSAFWKMRARRTAVCTTASIWVPSAMRVHILSIISRCLPQVKAARW